MTSVRTRVGVIQAPSRGDGPSPGGAGPSPGGAGPSPGGDGPSPGGDGLSPDAHGLPPVGSGWPNGSGPPGIGGPSGEDGLRPGGNGPSDEDGSPWRSGRRVQHDAVQSLNVGRLDLGQQIRYLAPARDLRIRVDVM